VTVAEVATDAAPPDDDTSASASTPTKRRRGFGSVFMEYAVLITVAITLALLIRGFLGLVFWIPSESMVPTFKIDDRVVVSRLSYRMHDVHRSDIVVFQNPHWSAKAKTFPLNIVSDLGEFVGVGQDRDKIFIKRVIGLPGETISGKDGHVYINGNKLAEPYLVAGVVTSDFQEYKVPPGHFFMMGDNRGNSCDSRCFTDPTGASAPFIAKDKIVGMAFLRIWPFSRIGKP
jgi:signal peptidase I